MKILMIGNGFDIEHGLATRYVDFLSFVSEFQKIYKELEKHSIKVKDIDSVYFKSLFSDNESLIVDALVKLTFENLWIKYFQIVHKMHLKNKENWIDFESEISEVIKILDSAIKFYGSEEKEDSSNSVLPKYMINRLKWVMGEDKILERNNIRKCITKLLYDLERLICALEIYIWDYIDFTRYYGTNIEYYNPDINEILPDAVLSFNYSDTYRRVYGYKRKNIEYDFIHGKAKNNLCHPLNIDDLLEKSNLVLGIDDYLSNDSKEIDFIAFKKYYQRIYKRTGNQYKKWLKQIHEKREESLLYIFGHSLDETDGDILRDLIEDRGYVLEQNYIDIGHSIYLFEEESYQGGSGAGCSASVLATYIMDKLESKEFKKVLLVATGALMSTTSNQQGDSIPSVAHLIELVAE